MAAHEERRRLSAAWLNIVAAGVISAGAVTPTMLLLTDHSGSTPRLLAVSTLFLIIGCVLHAGARALVKEPGSSQPRFENKPRT